MMQEEEEKLSKSGRENKVGGMCGRKGKVVMRCVHLCVCASVSRERERES